MRLIKVFLVICLLQAAGFWLPYFSGVFALRPLQAPDGMYILLTAFTYTAQLSALCLALLVMKLQMAYAWIHPQGGGALLKVLEIWYVQMVYWLFCTVFANKFYWWYQITFAADTFGYDTTNAATSALLFAIATHGVIGISLCRIFGFEAAKRVTVKVAIAVASLSTASAVYVAFSQVY